MDDKIKLEIEISKDLFERILRIQNYENFKNEIRDKRREDGKIIDFILGSTVMQVNTIENYERLFLKAKDLGKPFKLRNRFKKYLKEMKQIELAEITEIDKGNLSMILNNRTQPSLDYFIRIWVALGCPPIDEVLYRD